MSKDSKSGVLGAVGGVAKLDKFDGQGNVERFLDHFEVVSKANGWTIEVQALQLPTALCGAAFDFFRRLPGTEKSTVEQLKKALEKEYSTTALESDYALQFVSRRRQADESLPDFGDALKTLSRKAYPSFKDEQLESLCKTHFINGGLSDTLRAQLLMDGKPSESYRDLIARARRLEQVFAPPPSAVRRVPVPSPMEQELQRLTSVVSALERKVEALSVTKSRYDEKKKSDRGPQTSRTADGAGAVKKPVICFRCKQPGHLARGCANFE